MIQIVIVHRRLDKVTDMLCGLLRKIERRGKTHIYVEEGSELDYWWQEHKKQDERRMERERQEKRKLAKLNRRRKAALAKLTKEDMEVLNLNTDDGPKDDDL